MTVKELQRERMFAEIIMERDGQILQMNEIITGMTAGKEKLETEIKDLQERIKALEEGQHAD